MNNVDLTELLPILSTGLWVGVSMVFVSKMLSFVISKIIQLFKLA